MDVDKAAASAFFVSLFGVYTDGWIEYRALGPNETIRRGAYRLPYCLTGADHVSMVDQLTGLSVMGFDVYVGVLPRTAPPGPGNPSGRKAVETVGTAWIDLDAKVDGADASMLDDMDIVVSSGNGWHGYKLVHPPTKVTSDKDRKKIETKLRAWCLQVCPGVDNVSDLARILRVPGTVNFKDRANPKRVELIKSTASSVYKTARINRWHPWFHFGPLEDVLTQAQNGLLGKASPTLWLPSGRPVSDLDGCVVGHWDNCMEARRVGDLFRPVLAWLDMPHILAHVYKADVESMRFPMTFPGGDQ